MLNRNKAFLHAFLGHVDLEIRKDENNIKNYTGTAYMPVGDHSQYVCLTQIKQWSVSKNAPQKE